MRAPVYVFRNCTKTRKKPEKSKRENMSSPADFAACRWSHIRTAERANSEAKPHHSPRKYALISSSEGSAGSGSRPGMNLVASYNAYAALSCTATTW